MHRSQTFVALKAILFMATLAGAVTYIYKWGLGSRFPGCLPLRVQYIRQGMSVHRLSNHSLLPTGS